MHTHIHNLKLHYNIAIWLKFTKLLEFDRRFNYNSSVVLVNENLDTKKNRINRICRAASLQLEMYFLETFDA